MNALREVPESSPLEEACARLHLLSRVLETTGWRRAEAIAKASMVAIGGSESLAATAHDILTEALRAHSEAEKEFLRALDDCRLAFENEGRQ